ncbi:hypothetical protein H696_04049 [Fonticula alba]|uniref:Uncharacterized protein n=1 Tax=Fonticula alba TaxID=691883 RepID=A0A058Z685_FONAL|nr:hypothetical protein H696_04049 [Fonticula alba]KCV69631.1 hypothetical protein H696_04049 [Fonticula alba]|eukprot:XP_009496196.1 hypothetical protein H696_04049 [Fonticula alba]
MPTLTVPAVIAALSRAEARPDCSLIEGRVHCRLDLLWRTCRAGDRPDAAGPGDDLRLSLDDRTLAGTFSTARWPGGAPAPSPVPPVRQIFIQEAVDQAHTYTDPPPLPGQAPIEAWLVSQPEYALYGLGPGCPYAGHRAFIFSNSSVPDVFAGAVTAGQQADRQHGHNLPLKRWASELTVAGIEQARAGHFDKAINSYNSALDLDPEHLDCLVARGAALANTRHLARALDDFERVLQLQPNHPNAKLYYDSVLERHIAEKAASLLADDEDDSADTSDERPPSDERPGSPPPGAVPFPRLPDTRQSTVDLGPFILSPQAFDLLRAEAAGWTSSSLSDDGSSSDSSPERARRRTRARSSRRSSSGRTSRRRSRERSSRARGRSRTRSRSPSASRRHRRRRRSSPK